MARQQIVRLDPADLRRTTDFRGDQETGSSSGEGIYFRLCERCRHMTAAITRTVADAIRPRDDFFGSDARAASFTPADRRLAWFGVIAGIAGLAALLLFAWSEFGAGTVNATERPADSSSVAAAAPIETQPERTEAIRQRGLQLLRSDTLEDAPPQLPARGDRPESQDAAMKPVMRIATAGEANSIVVPDPLQAQAQAQPAADKPATAKDKAAKAEAVKERQARRAAKKARDQARAAQEKAAQAKAVQVSAEPQAVAAAAPPEEDNALGWVRRLPDTIAGGWENLWAKGNGGGAASCSPSANPATGCAREAQAGPR
jgi:hypothetical protein